MNLRNLYLLLTALILLTISSCTPVVSTKNQELPYYNGPQIDVLIVPFQCDLATCKHTPNPYVIFDDESAFEIGNGISDLLITKLTDSNRFNVIETTSNVTKFSALASYPENFDSQGAKFVVTGKVERFYPSVTLAKREYGGQLAGLSNFLSFFSGNKQRAFIDVRLRIFEVSTQKLISSSSIDIHGPGIDNRARIQNAIASVLSEAAITISEVIPHEYYSQP